jgi:putative flippase GtrA
VNAPAGDSPSAPGKSAAATGKSAVIASKYVLFAAAATGCNLGAQALMDGLYHGSFTVYVSLFVGTLVGLVVKYVLDKRFIFYDDTRGTVHRGWQFVRYVATGVVTTAVFWGLELGAYHAFHTQSARYLGGAIGLAIGYWTKYHLDKRLVFLQGPGLAREGR